MDVDSGAWDGATDGFAVTGPFVGYVTSATVGLDSRIRSRFSCGWPDVAIGTFEGAMMGSADGILYCNKDGINKLEMYLVATKEHLMAYS